MISTTLLFASCIIYSTKSQFILRQNGSDNELKFQRTNIASIQQGASIAYVLSAGGGNAGKWIPTTSKYESRQTRAMWQEERYIGNLCLLKNSMQWGSQNLNNPPQSINIQFDALAKGKISYFNLNQERHSIEFGPDFDCLWFVNGDTYEPYGQVLAKRIRHWKTTPPLAPEDAAPRLTSPLLEELRTNFSAIKVDWQESLGKVDGIVERMDQWRQSAYNSEEDGLKLLSEKRTAVLETQLLAQKYHDIMGKIIKEKDILRPSLPGGRPIAPAPPVEGLPDIGISIREELGMLRNKYELLRLPQSQHRECAIRLIQEAIETIQLLVDLGHS